MQIIRFDVRVSESRGDVCGEKVKIDKRFRVVLVLGFISALSFFLMMVIGIADIVLSKQSWTTQAFGDIIGYVYGAIMLIGFVSSMFMFEFLILARKSWGKIEYI